MIGDLAICLYVVALVVQILYWLAAPSVERLRLLLPVSVVGALTIAKIWPAGLDRLLGTNVSDIVYTVLCVVSVATTHFFVGAIAEPHIIPVRVKVYHYCALMVLIPGAIYQWLAGPYHSVETGWDASDWQVLGHSNWLFTIPCRLYITVGVATVGFTLRRYALEQDNDRAWRSGLLCMSAGVALAAVGNVSTIIRMFVDVGAQPYTAPPTNDAYHVLTSAAFNTQYAAVAAFAVGLTIPGVPKAAPLMQSRTLHLVWKTLNTVFPSRSIIARLESQGEERRVIVDRQIVEIIEGLGLVFIDRAEQLVVTKSVNPPAGLGRLLAKRGITAHSPMPDQVSASQMLTRTFEFSEQRRRVLTMARAYNRQCRRAQLGKLTVRPQHELNPTRAF